MSGVVWEDPPERPSGGGPQRVWEKRLAPLSEHPGKWANLGQHSANIVSKIKRGHLPGVEAGEFEAVGRNHQPKGQITVYARYVGGDQ